jgi:sugar/nucleoside kinase (ribokinase family)
MTALPVPQHEIRDTSGAGDIFHGAYIHSYLANLDRRWDEHFRFARAAAAHKIQHLGNEAGLPTLADIEAIRRRFGEP